MCFAIVPQYFGWAVAGVVVACHGKAIGTGIVETQYVPIADFRNLAVVGKGVGLADIPHNRVKTLPTFRIGNVFYAVLCAIEHGAYQVVKTTVYLSKYR